MKKEECFYCNFKISVVNDPDKSLFDFHLRHHKTKKDLFERAVSVMHITNQILDPIKIPIKERQLHNDRVDRIIQNYIKDIKIELLNKLKDEI